MGHAINPIFPLDFAKLGGGGRSYVALLNLRNAHVIPSNLRNAHVPCLGRCGR